MKHVPFLNLHEENKRYKEDFFSLFEKHLTSSDFILGDEVQKFEMSFSRALNIKHCISCANGTDALIIALKALGIGPGDEVIIPVHTWISTAECVSSVGAKVVFADTTAQDNTICLRDIKRKVSTKTKAVILVHLYGQPCDVSNILEFCRAEGIKLIEDCAQAHFAMVDDKYVGTYADIATFSFFPTKILGALGDAGCIVTEDDNLAIYCKKYSRHGGLSKGEHEFPGINSRMDTIQAAFLNIKLRHVNDIFIERSRLADYYLSNINETDILSLPKVSCNTKHGWHLFVLKTKSRNELIQYFKKYNIGFNIHYPKLLHQTNAYLDQNNKYPNAEKAVKQVLSIPFYPGMPRGNMKRVVDCLNSFTGSR